MIRTEAELRAWAEANYAALNRRDWDALFTDTDPAVEWDPVEENVSYRGRHAILEYFERWFEAWEEFEVELERFEVAPSGDRTLATVRYRGKSAASDVPTEGRFFHVSELRDGLWTRGAEYLDERPARAAFEGR